MGAISAFQFGFWFAAGVTGFMVCAIAGVACLLALLGYLLGPRG